MLWQSELSLFQLLQFKNASPPSLELVICCIFLFCILRAQYDLFRQAFPLPSTAESGRGDCLSVKADLILGEGWNLWVQRIIVVIDRSLMIHGER